MLFKKQIAKILSGTLTKAFGVNPKDFTIIPETIKASLKGIKAQFEVMGTGVEGTGSAVIGMT